MFLFSLYQARRSISENRLDTMNLETNQNELRRQVVVLDQQMNKVMLAVEALVELLSEREILHRDDVLQRMEDIDLRDGKADGKITRAIVECADCKRPIGPTSKCCLYCGSERPSGAGLVSG